ncbi:MAG: hypothetical protein WC375_09820 [Methanomassiliicoccales archaeon]
MEYLSTSVTRALLSSSTASGMIDLLFALNSNSCCDEFMALTAAHDRNGRIISGFERRLKRLNLYSRNSVDSFGFT